MWVVIQPRRFSQPYGSPAKHGSTEMLLYRNQEDPEPACCLELDGCHADMRNGSLVRVEGGGGGGGWGGGGGACVVAPQCVRGCYCLGSCLSCCYCLGAVPACLLLPASLPDRFCLCCPCLPATACPHLLPLTCLPLPELRPAPQLPAGAAGPGV